MMLKLDYRLPVLILYFHTLHCKNVN